MGLFNKSFRYNPQTNDNKAEIPGWLKMLQDNSWELEILISGGAIFTLFGLSDIVTDFFRNLINTTQFPVQNIIYISSMLATRALTLGFLIHILVRSFWVSLVALSSIFSNNSIQKPIRYAKPFNNKRNSNLYDYIIKVDKISAWMIYNSFTMAFILAGWILLLIVLTWSTNLYPSSIASFLLPFLMSAYAIYILDFLLFSSLRRIPYVSYLLYPIFKIFDIISLRFVSQPGIDYLSGHLARWKIALFYISFIILACIYTYLSVQKRLQWANLFDGRKYKESLTISDEFHTLTYYRSANAAGVHRVSIQSDIVTEPVLNLFINYSVRYDDYIDRIEDENNRYFQNIFDIEVDDSLYTDQKFFSTYLYEAGPSDRGIYTFIDVSSFENGLHELKIKINVDPDPKNSSVVIPFYLSVLR